MGGNTTAAAWLFGTEPTDRALAGWRPRVWIALGRNAMFAKEWAELARFAPVRHGWAWFSAVTVRETPGGGTS
jgi:hypothetical protein